MEPIKCSPEIKNETTGLFERDWVYNECSPECEHYQECIKKHKLKNNKFPVWEEVDSTPREIEAGAYHHNWQEDKLKTWHLKYSQ